MKKWIGLLALMTAVSNVSATNLFEPFNEALGNLGGNLAPNGKIWEPLGTTVPGIQVTSGNLTYPNIVPPTGNEVTFGTSIGGASGDATRVDIGGSNAGSIYFSLEFNVSSTTASSAAGFIAGFSNSIGTATGTTGTTAFRLYTRPDSSITAGYDLGLGINVAPTTYSGVLTPGATYFLVGEWSLGGIANLWIDPAASTFGTNDQPATTTASGGNSLGVTGGTDPNAGFTGYKAESFFLRQNTSSPSSMIADEVRVGGTYASVTAVDWTSMGDTGWGTPSNWSGGAVPGGQGADINFGADSSVTTVNLDTAPPALQTVGTIRFSGSAGYTVTGSSTLTLDTPTNGDLNIGSDAGTGASGPNGAAFINSAANPAQIIIAGTATHTISAPVYFNRSTLLTVPAGSTLNLTGGASANTSSSVGVWLSLAGGGNAAITPSNTTAFTGLTGLSINGNLKFNPAHSLILLNTGTATVTSSNGTVFTNNITTFNMGAGSSLDLTNNDLIVNRNPGDGGIEATILNALERGYNQGAWNGTSTTGGVIFSSTAASTPGTSLAYVDNALTATPLTTVDGQAVSNLSVIVKYTWYGDLDLDGAVTYSDLATITNDAGMTNVGWSGGDLNYDGKVNADDISLFQLGAAESNGANINDVPEPGTALAATAIALVAARRRRVISK